ncbi:stalk domain-containing protein [Paenibacillus cymbidii]|uniref:stalk domain-containing protein n=1 Tax=Paenibacillus cymbidii TaxID=1639034 RepID=UPI001082036B|nr:stalk domain-containing protein [Paenibacillus cymbidii]
MRKAQETKKHKSNRSRRRLLSMLLLASLAIPAQTAGWLPGKQPVAYAAATTGASAKIVSEEPITAGATLRNYVWSATRGTNAVQTNVHVIVVDLQNPNVKLDVIAGVDGQFTKKETVKGMAADTGAVAAVNGDFFATAGDGAPIGAQITGGTLESSAPFLPGIYQFAVSKNNTPIIDQFTFSGKVTAADGATFDIAGVNKAPYWFVPSGEHSHVDAIHLYTDAWGSKVRAVDRATDLLEVLVQNGVVMQKKEGALDMLAPSDGYILRTEGKGAAFIRQHVKVGDKIKAEYSLAPLDPTKQYDTAKFKTMIGGQPLLVNQGQAESIQSNAPDPGSYRSRTAVGYPLDQRYAYIITADKGGNSAGMSLPELQQFMISLGLWMGLNLDGGGSTQMVSRPLGETGATLVGTTENNYERPVVNGLGVFSTAPKGQVKGIQLSGKQQLLIGEKATYGIKAYDEYYNPVDATQTSWQWNSSNAVGTLENGTFTATAAGKTTLTAAAGLGKGTLDVQVIGRGDIASMQVQPAASSLIEGADVALKVKVTTKAGVERVLPGNLFSWEASGFQGTVTDGVLHVYSMDGAAKGAITASYDGMHAMATLPVGEKRVLADFDAKTLPVSFTGTAGVKGQVGIVSAAGAAGSVSKAVYMNYDMTGGSGTLASYIAFGDGGTGVTLEGEPRTMVMNVEGDKSLNWLRAEMIDADGKLYYVPFTDSLSWTGWRTVTADLVSQQMTYPVKLRKVYLANPPVGQDERAKRGAIKVDDIAFLYEKPLAEAPRNQVQLTIGSRTITVNGAKQTVDAAPEIVNDNTLVPLRFVIQALGGSVEWNEAERKVTVKQGDRLGELWIGNPNLNIGGTVVAAEVAPMIKNDYTMVPLRVLTQGFGWTVSWNETTRTVSLA